MKSTIKLRDKIFITLLILMVARLGIFIPVPGIDHNSLYNQFEQNGLINFLNIFSGGGLLTIGIFALGIVPYINSSIVMQIMTKVIKELENLQKDEGEAGRQKITQITRYLTLIWALLQSSIISFWIKPYVFIWNSHFIFNTILTLTTGSIIIMWFSEIISEYGIGNGASLLIFQNIVSGMPKIFTKYISEIKSEDTFLNVMIISIVFIAILMITISMQEGKRKISIISARQLVKIQNLNPQSYIPLKLNQGGVMPLVFASAAMALPSYLTQIIRSSINQNFLQTFMSNSVIYLIIYGMLIIAFSYFYTSLVLNPEDIAKNLKKMGASIPNIRPGVETAKYLNNILNKLTFLGAIFLFIIALVPQTISYFSLNPSFRGFGVTSLLILVSVAIDTARQIQTYIISQQYDNMME
uniref:Protein translocase subunit SecY n=1 Tax=Riquetophycus sp. TaxID=1897556 RepID=A0A1C9C8G3_9FLOR|nr:preprotein translocase subunit SecY [Riquetophycus sp.]